MNKFVKLGVLGILCFSVVFLLILFSTGFFNRSLPQRCAGKNCLSLNPSSVKEQNLVINNSSFATKNPSSIIVKKDEGLAVTVLNKDDTTHRILELYSENGKYKVYGEFFVEPKQKVSLIGFFNLPAPTSNDQVHQIIIMGDWPMLMHKADINEYLISCTTCTGENSKVRLVLEK